ncbi:hypothetical protein CDL15_Pgr025359 [Punica granatum]|uniref:F-box domain-containing protein n=1 Tax=Punica granatum TaxID=22663 RepID=A0A218WAQ9_PUNGR|nr:hypothetical protein CDL15_Pgr025359 [Punica granatum]
MGAWLLAPVSSRHRIDRGSLPDEVLILILSLVTTKEAAKTSILSHRWKYLWVNIPNLDFAISPQEMESDRSHKYIGWVNQVVAASQGQATTLDKFNVAFLWILGIQARSTPGFSLHWRRVLELNCYNLERSNYSFQMLQPRLLSIIVLLKSLSPDYVASPRNNLLFLVQVAGDIASLMVTDPDWFQICWSRSSAVEVPGHIFCPRLLAIAISAPTPDLV